jgi:transposase-like protein
MALPELNECIERVVQANTAVSQTAEVLGKDHPAYKSMLKEFAVAWFVLRSTRDRAEFLPEVN